MIASYNRLSLAFGIPGIILQIGGQVVSNMATATAANQPAAVNPLMATVGLLAALAGTALLLVGLAYYAKAKGRNPAWCLLAFLSCIGLIVLACLSDQSEKAPPPPINPPPR
jgi:hypothetical protein